MSRRFNYIIYTYFSFVIGMASGALLYFFVFHNRSLFDIQILYNSGFFQLPVETHYARYILFQRISVMLFLLLLIFLFGYRTGIFLINYLAGLYYIFFSLEIILSFGIKGMLIQLLLFFPHFIIYYYCILLIVHWFEVDNGSSILCFDHINKINIFVKIMIVILLIAVGVCWEIFFQKNFLKIFSIYCI